jgi:hypothetical protein
VVTSQERPPPDFLLVLLKRLLHESWSGTTLIILAGTSSKIVTRAVRTFALDVTRFPPALICCHGILACRRAFPLARICRAIVAEVLNAGWRRCWWSCYRRFGLRRWCLWCRGRRCSTFWFWLRCRLTRHNAVWRRALVHCVERTPIYIDGVLAPRVFIAVLVLYTTRGVNATVA